MSQLTSSDGTTIAFERTGDGPAVVLIHVGPFTQALTAGVAGLIEAGQRGDAVAYWMTSILGMPEQIVASMRQAPFWAGMEAEAHGLVADYALVGDLTFPPVEQLRAIKVPTLVLDGGAASPMAPAAAQVAQSS